MKKEGGGTRSRESVIVVVSADGEGVDGETYFMQGNILSDTLTIAHVVFSEIVTHTKLIRQCSAAAYFLTIAFFSVSS